MLIKYTAEQKNTRVERETLRKEVVSLRLL